MSKDTVNGHAVPMVSVPRLNAVLIGERLQALRNARRLTGDDVARLTGIPRSSIGAIETGRMVPDPARLLAFSAAFDVSIDYILTGEPLGREKPCGDAPASES